MAKKKKTVGIIGLGKFGMYLATELVASGINIVCLDKDERKVKRALEICDYAFVTEDLSVSHLKDIGYKECDVIVVCIGDQMDSAIFATMNSLELGCEKVIALGYSEESGKVLEKLGAQVIYPYKDSASHLCKNILSNNVLDFISLNDEVEICEVKLPGSYIGMRIKDTDARSKFGINIIAIEKQGKIITRIDPEYTFVSGDALVVLGEKKMLRKFEQKK